MTQDGASGTPQKQFSPTLISLLSLIELSNASSTTAEQSEEIVKNLVALRTNSPSQENTLGLKDLTIALRTSFCDYLPTSLYAKVEIVGWVASLLQSQATYKTRTICAVIQELAEVLKFRWLNIDNVEHWLPLCIQLLLLSNACVDALRKQHESALAGFLNGPGWTQLSQIVVGSNATLFKMISSHPASRSTPFKTWCKEAFEAQSNFYAFLDTQILSSTALRSSCGSTITMVCNLFLISAKEFISELKLLNLSSKALVRLIPYCYDTNEYRLNREGIVLFVCFEACSNAQETLSVAKLSSEREQAAQKKAFTLLRFFISHLRHIIRALATFLCRTDDSAAKCRDYIRFTLFHLRSRLLSNEACANMHPSVYSDMVKFIGPLEDVCISTLLEEAQGSSDSEIFQVFYEFCYTGQPKLDQFNRIESLTPYEWNCGRLYIILRTMTVFDQLSPDLQLRLFPPSKMTSIGHHYSSARFSLINSLVSCLVQLRRDEFVPLMDRKAQSSSDDLYLQVLSDLAIFALLIQPEQFTTLRVEMLGLVFHTSEVISLLAIDWWRCMADRLGQSFIVEHVLVLSDMLGAIPNGDASDRLSRLIRSLCHMLDSGSQTAVAESVLSKLEGMSSRLLSNFPFGSLSGQNLDNLTNKITETWRGCFEHLEDLNIVVDVFYAMHPYIASLVSVFSSPQHAGGLHNEVHQSVAAWCVNLLIGCQELVSFAQSRPKSIEKITCTVEHVVTLLRVIQPLSTADLIQVLSAFTQWIHLNKELQPLSSCGLTQFLASCGAVEVFDEEEQAKIQSLLKTLYTQLLEDSHWFVIHQAAVSLAKLSAEARSPEILQDVIPATAAETVRRYQHHELQPEQTTAKAEKAFWAQIQQSLDHLAPSCTHATPPSPTTTVTTLRNLKALSNPKVSKQECLQGLRAATTYLEGLTQESPDSLDQGLRAQLAAEMWTLQSLMQRLVTPPADDKTLMPTMNGGQ